MIAEIGSITVFHSSDALVKYAGLTWCKGDSGDFELEDTPITRAGNTYLRCFLGEAANSVRQHIPEYQDYYARKYAEVPKYQHKGAFALTSRKFVRLVFGLLVKKTVHRRTTGRRIESQSELTFGFEIKTTEGLLKLSFSLKNILKSFSKSS